MMTLVRSLLDTQSAGPVALLIALGIMATRIARVPTGRGDRSGTSLHSYPVATRFKLRRQRLPLMLLALVAGAEAALGLVPSWELASALAAAAGILAIPLRCEITTEGVRVGWLPVRRWTEFGGLRVRRGMIHLQPISGSSGFAFPLTGRFEDGDLVAEVRGLITLAYKGARLPVSHVHGSPVGRESVEEGQSTPLTIMR